MFVVTVAGSDEPEHREYWWKPSGARRAAAGGWLRDRKERQVRTWPEGRVIWTTSGLTDPRQLSANEMSNAVAEVFGKREVA